MNAPFFRRPFGRRLTAAAAAVVAGTLALSGCAAGVQNQDGGDASSSDELRVAITAYPSSWDQDFVGFDLTALTMYKNVYPYLIDYGVTEVDGGAILDTTDIFPTWAESFESENGMDWTLTIKEGATFPSGNPITAEDVKWSKDRAFAAGANVAGLYSLIGLTDPSQVEVVDERTVAFHQEFPSALTEQIQAISLFIYDSVLMQEHATDDDPWAADWAAQNPTDGGYFVVDDAVPGQEIVLKANPDYLGDNGANVETVRFTVVSDTATAAVMLREGDVDLALGLSAAEVADLEGAEGVKILTAPNNEMVSIPLNTTMGPLADVRVRQAVANAIPYDQIISTVYGGDARLPKSLVPIDMPGYTEDGFPYTQDLDAARDLLAEAGVENLTLQLAYAAEDGEAEQIAVLVQDALGEIDVTVEPLPLDPATLGERRAARDLDMQITAGSQWVNDVEYLIGTTFSEGAALNYSGYSSPAIADLVVQARSAAEAGAREAIWGQVQEVLAQDVPGIPLAQPDFALPVRDNVDGFVQPVDSLIRFNTFTLE
ncbi:ABC transporter substrate-binding protein [Agromyces aerolatus]|uniref:ABC transporter substrate-binding protein n=1 Tax=Agromyces sp. LY-1074 TaxID=3074080 RepID=UPI002867123C|nr:MULTISPECIES: ABC transporter substrate-binding protein [unclassified Agromyces]MDR5698342.1 ABC transporter substrate-binding protein [Agromyces sp. LY-1074]MDR5704636.1 ABC transporter substrate-binding protein [Agromyces sp. LY-1358]